MKLEDLRDHWLDDGVLLLEPQDVFNQALIGLADCPDGSRAAAYDSARCISALMRAHGWSLDEATIWFESNTRSAYFGENSPVFVDVLPGSVDARNGRCDDPSGSVKLLGPRW